MRNKVAHGIDVNYDGDVTEDRMVKFWYAAESLEQWLRLPQFDLFD